MTTTATTEVALEAFIAGAEWAAARAETTTDDDAIAEAEAERLRGLLRDAGVLYTGPSADAAFQAEKHAGLREFFRTVNDRIERQDY